MRARTLNALIVRLLAPPAVLLGLLLPSTLQADTGLWQQVQAMRDDQAYSDASAWRRAQVRAVIADLVRSASSGTISDTLRRRIEAAGLQLEEHGSLLVVQGAREHADGFYAIRMGSELPPLVLQAPHAWHDKHTGQLACSLFEQGFGRVLLLNSAHRNSSSHGDISAHDSEVGGADVAHRAESIFQAATLGAADALEDPLVLQLHGFASSHGHYSAVVSDGATLQPHAVLEQSVQSLRAHLGAYGPIATGEQVPDLAGTTNVQSRALTGMARFLHIEMSLPVRVALLANPMQLEQVGHTLQRLTEREP